PTSTAAGSPTDSMTSMSSKRRFMGTRRMIDPTALHAPDTPASHPQWVCGPGSRDVLGLITAGRAGARGRRGRLRTGRRRNVVAVQGVAHDLGEDGGRHRPTEDRSGP